VFRGFIHDWIRSDWHCDSTVYYSDSLFNALRGLKMTLLDRLITDSANIIYGMVYIEK